MVAFFLMVLAICGCVSALVMLITLPPSPRSAVMIVALSLGTMVLTHLMAMASRSSDQQSRV